MLYICDRSTPDPDKDDELWTILESKWGWNEISIEFELRWKNR